MPRPEEINRIFLRHFNDANCQYYQPHGFNQQYSSDKSSLKVINFNIRSVKKNMDEFILFLKSVRVEFHIIVLTETWLDDEAEFLDVAGYRAYHSVRTKRGGGGVSVLVSNEFDSKSIPNLSFVGNLYEMCSVEVVVGGKKLNVLGVYRPPHGSIEDFNNSFFDLISHSNILNSFCVVTGDFNINTSPNDMPGNVQSYLSEFYSLHFTQTISLPTRIQGDSSTILDHIWTNMFSGSRSGVIPVLISDHYPVFVCFSNILAQRQPHLVSKKFRDHSQVNLQKLENRVIQFINGFQTNITDVNESCRKFVDTLYNIYNSACPIKQKTISQKRLNSPWITDELIGCIARKHELYRLSQSDERFKQLYKEYRNTLTTTIRDKKRKYYENKLSDCRDVKRTWKEINAILRPNAKNYNEKTLSVTVDGETLRDPATVANVFNVHYTSVARNLANRIPATNVDATTFVSPKPFSFFVFPTNASEIHGIITSFRSKGSHIYAIPSFVYKRISQHISSVLAIIINKSFSCGVFPDVLKLARVIPIFKSGEKNVIANYRPISTVDFISKVFERAMFNRISKFLDTFNIINSEQFGFRRGLSTTDAILNFTDSAYDAFNDGDYLVSVLLDFSKAFDTVDHDILLKKLSLIGIRDLPQSWFKSYLTNRRQYVEIENISSPPLPINIGVPQGSILGPLLFIIYINDMCKCSNKLGFVHFADDTTVFIRGKNLDSVYAEMNSELVAIDTWLCANKLSLNIKKTSVMTFSHKSLFTESTIRIRESIIECVHKAKFLGIIIDDKLNYKDHINSVVNKVSKSCGVLRKLSASVPSHILKKLYFTLVYPFLVYGIEAWGHSSLTIRKKLDKVQYRCLKIFNNNFFNVHMFKILKIFPVDLIYEYFVNVKFFRYYVLGKNSYFKNNIDQIQIVHALNTRFKRNGLLTTPHILKSKCFNSFLYQSIVLWNRLPTNIKSCSSLIAFKKILRNFYCENALATFYFH